MDAGLRRPRPLRLSGFDPVGYLLRLDAGYRERRRLRELTPEQLHDIGLTPSDVERMLGRG